MLGHHIIFAEPFIFIYVYKILAHDREWLKLGCTPICTVLANLEEGLILEPGISIVGLTLHCPSQKTKMVHRTLFTLLIISFDDYFMFTVYYQFSLNP